MSMQGNKSMSQHPNARDREASKCALKATAGARAAVRTALESYIATQQRYWGQYEVAFEQALVDMAKEDEDARME